MSFEIISGQSLFPSAGPPLRVVRTTNGTQRRHGHDFQELVLVVQGEATNLLYAPGSDTPTSTPLETGDVLFIPVGWSHSYLAEGHFEIYNILFDASLLSSWNASGDLFQVLGGLADPASSVLIGKLSLRSGEREALEVLLRTIVRELTLQQDSFEIAAHLKLTEAVVLLERIAGTAQSDESRGFLANQDVVNRAISFMEERLREPIALRDIARAVHLSPNYFCELFTQTIGQPPGRFLLRLRLEHARYLLLTTERSITEIAHQCGFSDASYFARAFKAHFESPPSRLRSSGR